MPQKGQTTSNNYIHHSYDEWESNLIHWLDAHPLIKPQKRHLKQSFWLNRWKEGIPVGLMKNILSYSSQKPLR